MNRFRQGLRVTSRLLPMFMLLASCSAATSSVTTPALPRPDHIVIVFEENKAFSQIIGNPKAPFLNELAARGALFSQSFAITHPSQPNYLAFFSGSTQGVADDSCPHHFSTGNLASSLLEAGLTFGSYAESMPSTGYTGCVSGHYVRRHNPCVNWQDVNISASANMPFTEFPADFSQLPTVSLVIPDNVHNMHDRTIQEGDAWLKDSIGPYLQWAETHNSLLIVTWDEDDGSADNRIATMFAGPMVERGVYGQRIDHYAVLRTIEEMYGLSVLGNSAGTAAITNVWRDGITR